MSSNFVEYAPQADAQRTAPGAVLAPVRGARRRGRQPHVLCFVGCEYVVCCSGVINLCRAACSIYMFLTASSVSDNPCNILLVT